MKIIEKKKSSSSGLCCSSRPQSENQRKGKDREIFRFCQSAEKAVEHKGDRDTNCSQHAWNCLQMLGKKTGRNGNQRKNQEH